MDSKNKTWINFEEKEIPSQTTPNENTKEIKFLIEDWFEDEDDIEDEDVQIYESIEDRKYISMEEFVESDFASDLYNSEGEIEAFIVEDILSNCCHKKADEDNFFKNSFAIFSDVNFAKEEELRNTEPDYVSKNSHAVTSSIYWFQDGGVYRLSDHWGGGIRTCDWYLNRSDSVVEMEFYDKISEKGGTGNMYITDDLRAVIDAENIPQQINSYQELRELVESIEKQYNIRVLCCDWLDDDFNELSLDEEEGDGSEYTPIVGNKSVGGKFGFVKFKDIKFKDELCKKIYERRQQNV